MEVLEVEIKAYCSDPEDMIKKIKDLGGRPLETRQEIDTYMNHPGRDFGETDEALRLRKVNNLTVLTYKGPKVSEKAKTRYEEEVAVEDYGAMKVILERLGFHEYGTVSKIRSTYAVGDIEICVDSIDTLGHFIELEKKGTNKDEIESKLFDLAGQLGLDEFETRSYLEMLKEKEENRE
jgi:adenylate cyclase class 2